MDSIKGLYNRLAKSQTTIQVATVAVVLVWGLVLVALLAGWGLLMESQAQTSPQTLDGTTPAITLDPAAGPPGTTVFVHGEGWDPGSLVMIYLAAPGETELPSYAVAGLTADAEGHFTGGFVVPTGPEWENQGLATVTAQVAGGGASAQEFFSVTQPEQQPAETEVVTVEPTATATELITATPVPTTQPEEATATATTDLNVRSGPGTTYSVLGVLLAGQSAQITGISSDGGWWQIQFSGTADEVGWVSVNYVVAENTGNVPVVQASVLTATPTPTPTPTSLPVITDWQGEYYANRDLAGSPVLVRNDVTINFDWGTSSPASDLPADSFSARWMRTLAWDEGLYRFYVSVDDGVRLYVDDVLVIDSWSDGSWREVSGELWLSSGNHTLRVEYYEYTGDAVIQVWWEKVEGDTSYYSDWKGEYWSNSDLSGSPALVRNDVTIDFSWGTGSPAAGLPADNFSARWTRTWTVSEDRLYRLYIVADDGVRLWIDDVLVIDRWWDGGDEVTVEYWLDDGTHSLRLEYYEDTGDARILLWAEQESEEPEANFDASPRKGPAPLEVEFDNDSEGDYDSCEWDFGDDDTDDDCDDPSHTYWEAGEYTVELTVSGSGGEDSRERSEYIVVYEPVQASFSASPTSGEAPLTVNFTNLSAGDYDTCNWSLGDGATHTGCGAFSHTYKTEGSYPVTLTVSGSGGSDTKTKTNFITVVEEPVANQPPTSVINGPTSGLVGELLTFDGSSSSDPDGAILSYIWDLGDGATASGVNVSHSYGEAGSYNIILTVTDDGGLSDTSTYTLLIEESATDQYPLAVINGPAGALVGEMVVFDSGGSYDSDGTIVSYVWDFGDSGASAVAAQSDGSTMAHSYSASGSYQVTLTVTDDDGLSDTATHTIVVQESASNQPPIAEIDGPTSALVDETVTFDSGDSYDPDGTIVSYVWDFGDSGASAVAVAAQSGDSRMAHSYSASGSYQVTLTIADDGGLSDTVTHMIVIEDLVLNQPPTAVINGPTSGLVGELLTFDASSSSDPDGMIASYTWDFGDGSTAVGMTVNHSYNAAGTYHLILTITDDDGLSDTSTYTLLIEEPVAVLVEEAPTLTSEIPTSEPTPTPEAPSPTPTATAEPPSPTPEAPTPTPTPTPEPSPTPEAPTATAEPPTPTPATNQ